MRIAFIYLPGRLKRLDRARMSEMPTEFFYGAIELERRGHDIGFFEFIEQPCHNIIQLIFNYGIRTKYLPIKTYASSVDAAWKVRSQLNTYDVVVATTNSSAFSLGIWKKLHCFTPPIVGIICGLLNYPLNKPRVSLTRSLMQQMNSHLFGYGELEPIIKAYEVRDDCLEVNCFGVDLLFWKGGNFSERKGYILSIGNDSRRDYVTLLKAAKLVNRKFIVVTKRELPEPLPPNVEVIRGAWGSTELDDSALRRLYQEAFCVVVPIKPGVQPSGQSVTLQAMACNTPVVLSRTEGIWEHDFLEHGNNVLLIDPHSAIILAEEINRLCSNNELWQQLAENGRHYVEDHGAIDQFANRLEISCQTSCTGKSKQPIGL